MVPLAIPLNSQSRDRIAALFQPSAEHISVYPYLSTDPDRRYYAFSD
jgi:hypothetical protein